jgi:hypothetical protein
MIHSDPAHAYPSSSYDHNMCLKPPPLLWLAVLYLSRALTLPVAMAIGHFSGVDSSAITALRAYWSVDSLGPSLISAVILYAMCRRVPEASRWVRWVWARGRIVLSTAAVLDVAVLAFAVIRRGEFDNASLLSCGAIAVDLYFLLYTMTARRVRDAFAEFPPPLN